LSLRLFTDRIVPRSRPASTVVPPADEPIGRHRRRQSVGAVPSRLLERTFSTRSQGGNTRRYSEFRNETSRAARRHSGLWLERRPNYAKTRLDLQEVSYTRGRRASNDSSKSWCIDIPGAHYSIVHEGEERVDSPISFVDLEPLTFSPSSYVITLSDTTTSKSESWLSFSSSSIDDLTYPLPAPKPTRRISVEILSGPPWSSIPPEMDDDDSDSDGDWLREEFVPCQPTVIENLGETMELNLDWREFHTNCLESDDSYPTTLCEL